MADLVINGQTYSGIEVLKMVDTSHNEVFFGPSTLRAFNINDYIEGKSFESIYVNSAITKIRTYAFIARNATQSGKQYMYFPNCIEIGASAFTGAGMLIGSPDITNIYAPRVVTIGSAAFYSSKLQSAVFPECTLIHNVTFVGCSALSIVYMPKVQAINSNAFSGCSQLTSLSFPCCSFVGSTAFSSCAQLSTIALASIQIISTSAFTSCYNLSTVYLYNSIGNVNIYSSAFYSCGKLRSLYILHSQIASLSSYSVFLRTPLYNVSPPGNIFVPQSLVSIYQTTGIWSQYGFSSLFVGLTDAEVSEIKAQIGAQ